MAKRCQSNNSSKNETCSRLNKTPSWYFAIFIPQTTSLFSSLHYDSCEPICCSTSEWPQEGSTYCSTETDAAISPLHTSSTHKHLLTCANTFHLATAAVSASLLSSCISNTGPLAVAMVCNIPVTPAALTGTAPCDPASCLPQVLTRDAGGPAYLAESPVQFTAHPTQTFMKPRQSLFCRIPKRNL